MKKETKTSKRVWS